MSRAFCVPAALFLFSALIINILVTISLPAIPALDIARIDGYRRHTCTVPPRVKNAKNVYTGRGFCHYEADSHTCSKLSFAYSFGNGTRIVIPASLTRLLIFHPLATAATFVSFLFGFCSTNVFGMFLSSLLSLFAALVTIAAFAIDIIFYQHVRDNVGGGARVSTATWITLVAFFFLLFSAFTTGIGCQQERKLGKAVDALVNIKKMATIALRK